MNYYRHTYPELELNRFSDDVLREHARRFAVESGLSTCFYDRSEFLKVSLQKLIDGAHLKALEISPFDNPFLRGDNVKYFAVEDAEALRNSAVKAKRPFNNVPEKIHFISPTADLSVVDETFHVVFSSHVIEHCPDLVRHFQSISGLLKAGGVYVLLIPDKRYCFDHYHPESTIFEVIEAFVDKKKNARHVAVLKTVDNTHNEAVLHWLGEHGKRFGEGDDANAKEKLFNKIERYADSIEKGAYLDVHNWQFTPDSFGYIVNTLNRLGLIDLSILRLCHTLWGRFEFVAMLEKK